MEDNIDISLIRQFWTLPASLSVTASPSAIEYDSANPGGSSTSFSVSIPGLDGAPAGAVFTYSWKDADGNTVAGATGSTLTLTAGQMLGPGFTPLNASETRTYSVEVTYTEPSGEQAVRTGSATVTIATEATIVLEGSGVQTDDSGHQFLVLNKSASAAAFTARVLCYGGSVTYGWSTVSGGSATLTGISGAGNSVSPVSGGMTILQVQATLADEIDMKGAFYKDLRNNAKLPNLVKAPRFPDTAKDNDLWAAYSNCQNLVEAPEIPAGVTNMASCFQWCFNLIEAPEIPDGVTSLSACFDHDTGGRSHLQGPSVIRIPDSVTQMQKCFNGCTALGSEYHVDIIIEGTNVTNWNQTFHNISASQHVTVWVPDATVKAAIEAAPGNTGVEIKIGSGPSGP